MKKVITMMLMLTAVLTASAQGRWEIIETEADELKGTTGGTAYIYTDPEMGSFVFWGFKEYQYRLISDHAQFNIENIYNRFDGGHSGIIVLVGLYDANDKLIDKFDMWLDKEGNKSNRFVRTRDAGGMSNPVGQKGKVKKIFNALQSKSGYVRIVGERFDTTDFDIKIPPFKIE